MANSILRTQRPSAWRASLKISRTLSCQVRIICRRSRLAVQCRSSTSIAWCSLSIRTMRNDSVTSKWSRRSVFVACLMPLAAQTAYRAPRADGGHPDLNGIWQALNEANYDLEAHNAKPAMALRPGPYGPVPSAPVLALGAVGAVPPGLGVVDGDGVIPYKPEALAQRDKNRENWIKADPEIKCYLPGV